MLTAHTRLPKRLPAQSLKTFRHSHQQVHRFLVERPEQRELVQLLELVVVQRSRSQIEQIGRESL